MAKLRKRVATLKGTKRSHPRRTWDYEAANLEALSGMVSYLKYLYMEGEISDQAYQTLVSEALSIFVENSVTLKIDRAFDNIDSVLQQVDEMILLKAL